MTTIFHLSLFYMIRLYRY